MVVAAFHSQRGLARAAGVPPSTVSRIEAGDMDPTVGMLERLVAAAGCVLDLDARDGSPSIAWLALRSDARDLDWMAARGLADWATQHPAAVATMVAAPPPVTGSPVVDNLIAAIAETIADDAGTPAPSWCRRIPPLAKQWEAPGTPAMRRRWRQSTLPRFAARNVWSPSNAIWRERDDAGERGGGVLARLPDRG